MTRRFQLIRAALAIFSVGVISILAAIPFPAESPASEPPKAELPLELQFVPADAALFVSIDVAQIWDNPTLKAIRKADPKLFDDLANDMNSSFGFSPTDVKSLVAFVPQLHLDVERDGLAVVVTCRNAIDKEKFAKGLKEILSPDLKANLVVAGERAVVLINLEEEHAKPQKADKTGPLTAALKAAATGKHAIVAGMTLANFPEKFRGDDAPLLFLPYLPLLKAQTITATLDAGKSFDFNVHVKTGTAAQATECEKSLRSIQNLILEGLGMAIKSIQDDAANKASFKDLVTIVKTFTTAIKEAKYSTLGNETELSISLGSDLPFTSAYFSAKEKIEDETVIQTSANNLKQIALATINYADSMNGNLPPAAICDKTGKPLLSWRVLILPYIEQENLFKEFKLDEPWDSEHNKKLLAKMPKVYALPGKAQKGETNTYYRVFVGKGAGWDWVQGLRFPASITDGTSNTMMCVTAATAVPWTKPDELEFDPDKDMTKLIGTIVKGKAQMAMFDGSVHTLKKIPSKETVHALITPAGAEIIGDDFP